MRGLEENTISDVREWAQSHNMVKSGTIKTEDNDATYELLLNAGPRIIDDFAKHAEELKWSKISKLKDFWTTAIQKGEDRITTNDLAEKIFNAKATPERLFAVYSYFVDNAIYFTPDSD